MKFFILGLPEDRNGFAWKLQEACPEGAEDFLPVSMWEAFELKERFRDEAIVLVYVLGRGGNNLFWDGYNILLKGKTGLPGNLAAELEVRISEDREEDTMQECVYKILRTRSRQKLILDSIPVILSCGVMAQNRPGTLQMTYKPVVGGFAAANVPYDVAAGYLATDKKGTKALLYALFECGAVKIQEPEGDDKIYTTYDGSERCSAGVKDARTVMEWREFYRSEIDHEIYPDFDIWLEDMLRMGILS